MKKFTTLMASLAFAIVGHCQNPSKEIHGHWFSQYSADASEAGTVNDDGSTFGVLCRAEICQFYLKGSTTCQEGGRYPFLMNSDVGSTGVSTQCQSFNNGTSTYTDVVWFEETIKIASYLSKGELFGFAIPLNSGEFKVTRFRLKGATEAIGRATTAPSRKKIGDSRL